MPQTENNTGRAYHAGQRGRRPQQNRRKDIGKQYIHPSKFINKATMYEEKAYEPTHRFSDFSFGAELKYNIEQKGFDAPSAIQDQAIPHIIQGKDVIGLANTGTGKTAAFLLPLIERQSGIMLKPSVLVVTPTRELAQQIVEEFTDFSRGIDMEAALIVGGVDMNRQVRQLKRRPHFIVGTPGRLKDLIERRELQLKNMTTLVLDEADRMLDMGFLPDIKQIVQRMPRDRQSLFFSATMTPDIERLTAQFLKDPVTVQVRNGETSDHVEQDIIEVRSNDHKVQVLKELLEKDGYEKVLVFGDTKYGVQRLSDHLDNGGIPSVAIHGNKNQAQRQKALKQFKDEKVRVMVATDVAARGLDIPNVTHVINFDQPKTFEDYIHRIGRTGRGGASGHAHTFVEAV